MALISVRNLLYLCDYGIDDQTNEVLPCQLIQQQLGTAPVNYTGAELFAALYVMSCS